MVLQFTPSVRPYALHVVEPTTVPFTLEPGKPRNVAAMLPVGASPLNWEVGYHSVPVAPIVCACFSYAKKANILFFQIGPPMLPPHWLYRSSSRRRPRSAGVFFDPSALNASADPGPFQR